MTKINADIPARRGPAAVEHESATVLESSVRSADWRMLAVAALVPLFVAVVLFGLRVPLGKPGTFVYLYSPIVARRLAALPGAFACAALLGGGVWLACSRLPGRRRTGFLLASIGCLALGVWSYLAPPQFRSQHFFNMQSPSHDGAFLAEAGYARRIGVRAYLRGFPQRTQKPPAEMRGTRVISNPPGTTLIAVGALGVLERSPTLARAVDALGTEEGLQPEMARVVTLSTGFVVALLLLWLLSIPLLYAAGRVLLSSPAALVFALVVLVSPMTLLFVPGKDPAQLLTVALPLWLWLVGWRRDRPGVAGLAGGAFVGACLVSLVHVWIAGVVFVAGLFSTPPGLRLRFVLRHGGAAMCGALLVIGGLALLADFDFLGSAWSSARAQAEITRGEGAMPWVWQALGVPLFLLFCGPSLWWLGLRLCGERLRGSDARFGVILLVGSAVVMVATVGFTNVETPRLWIPFTPLLVLGAALQLATFRRPGRAAAALLAALVFAHVAASALQWTLMDVREAENRLLQSRDSGPRFFH